MISESYFESGLQINQSVVMVFTLVIYASAIISSALFVFFEIKHLSLGKYSLAYGLRGNFAHCGRDFWVGPTSLMVNRMPEKKFLICYPSNYPNLKILSSSSNCQIRKLFLDLIQCITGTHRRLQKRQIGTMIDPQVVNGDQQVVMIGSYISSDYFKRSKGFPEKAMHAITGGYQR